MRVWLLLALALIAACKREPSFDERYAEAQKVIGDKAAEIDAELATRESEAAQREGVPTQGTADERGPEDGSATESGSAGIPAKPIAR